MKTLVQAPPNDHQLNYHSKSVFPEENPGLNEFPHLSNGSFHDNETSLEGEISKEFSVCITHPSRVDESATSEGESFIETDYSDETLKFISQMLMEEEDLAEKPYMIQDCLALQATEKSLYDVLNSNNDEIVDISNDHFGSFVECNLNRDFESLILPPYQVQDGYGKMVETNVMDSSSNYLREKINRCREDDGLTEEQRSNKQLANNVGESEPLEMYDKVLLCPSSDSLMSACGEGDHQCNAKKQVYQKKQSKGSNRGRPRKDKKRGITQEVVDLVSLLMQCAQAVTNYDSRTANNILMQIRQHSSPYGDGTERLAHYFANALEAHVVGTGTGHGTASYAGSFSSRISTAEILKSYKTFFTACPFMKMSNFLANRTIQRLATGATTLHIIDFGILYGFQWPCLIQALSKRPGGPPKLRITGIDFPQPGFRPAERVADTGNRLKKYCERFGVPFEYNAIAQKWETIKLEDLKIEKNELLVVNSIYRLQNVSDETVISNSPRDDVLNLIKKINSTIFIQGVINATYNMPFFVTRFREALYYFSSMFDMFEATVPREDQHRLLFEKEILGKDVMNIIACEGTERVDRPETYRHWQVRDVRAGFKQIPLDEELVKYVKSKVKMDYHKDFWVDDDGKWLLQGWKGRVTHAISHWQPVN